MKTINIKYFTLLLGILSLSFMNIGCSSSDSSVGSGDSSSGTGGSMARFTISGDYLFTVDDAQLKMFDVSTPTKPRYLSGKNQQLGFGVETIFTMDTLLFIGSQNGMYIYDISRAGFPRFLSQTTHIQSCDPVVAQGNYAYVTLNTRNTWCGIQNNQLLVYDISKPTHPELVKTDGRQVSSPLGLGVDGNRLFVCDQGLKVFDISKPDDPIWMDDLSDIREADGIDAYDVIPLKGTLLLIGSDGLFQFSYKGDKLSFISKIEKEKSKDE